MSTATSPPSPPPLESNVSVGWLHSNRSAETLPETDLKPLLHIEPFRRGASKKLDTGLPESVGLTQSFFPTTEKNPEPVVLPKPFTFLHNRFVPLQKWEGVVLQKGDESFFARLVDLSTKSIDEEAEFPLEEVPESDMNLLEEGAVFYWDIGYLDQTNGQRIRASSIRFRRLPAWSGQELWEAQKRAKKLEALFARD